MGTSRTPRIGSREAERLLAAEPGADAYPALNDLLAAAAAPARPDELGGLEAAVAAFRAAGQDPPPRVAVPSRRRVFARSAAVKVAAGVAVALFGGTALAAETGSLPGGSQQRAHELFSGLGVPPPPSTRPTRTTPPSDARTAPAHTPTPAPSAGRPSPAPEPSGGATPGPAGAATHGQCRSFVARQQDPKKKPLPAEVLRDLAAAAGGEEHIAGFCVALLSGAPEQTAGRPPGTAPPTPPPAFSPAPTQPAPTQPGKDQGRGPGRPSKPPKVKG